MSVTPEHMKEAIGAAEARMDARVARIEASLQSIKEDVQGMRAEVRSTKWTLIPLVIGTGVALYFGFVQTMTGVLGNMIAAYESGKNTATAITQATEELKAIRERLDKAAPAAPPK